jgi:hypothetical protein
MSVEREKKKRNRTGLTNDTKHRKIKKKKRRSERKCDYCHSIEETVKAYPEGKVVSALN